jgi:hypothetical protein
LPTLATLAEWPDVTAVTLQPPRPQKRGTAPVLAQAELALQEPVLPVTQQPWVKRIPDAPAPLASPEVAALPLRNAPPAAAHQATPPEAPALLLTAVSLAPLHKRGASLPEPAVPKAPAPRLGNPPALATLIEAATSTATPAQPEQAWAQEPLQATRTAATAAPEPLVQQLHVELSPRELGRVVVRVETRGEQVAAEVFVARDSTRAVLAAAETQVREALEQVGLTVHSFRVVRQEAPATETPPAPVPHLEQLRPVPTDQQRAAEPPAIQAAPPLAAQAERGTREGPTTTGTDLTFNDPVHADAEVAPLAVLFAHREAHADPTVAIAPAFAATAGQTGTSGDGPPAQPWPQPPQAQLGLPVPPRRREHHPDQGQAAATAGGLDVYA